MEIETELYVTIAIAKQTWKHLNKIIGIKMQQTGNVYTYTQIIDKLIKQVETVKPRKEDTKIVEETRSKRTKEKINIRLTATTWRKLTEQKIKISFIVNGIVSFDDIITWLIYKTYPTIIRGVEK